MNLSILACFAVAVVLVIVAAVMIRKRRAR